MRIAIVAHNLRVGGGQVVGRNVVAMLPRIAPQHDYLMVVPAGAGFEPGADGSRVQRVEVGFGSLLERLRVERRVLPDLLRRFSPDWVWALGNVPLRRPGCRQALLVMDPHLFYPRRHYALETARNRAVKHLLRRHLASALRDVDVVFCQTESARRRFATSFRFAGRMALCPAAVSEFAVRPACVEVPTPLRGRERDLKVLVLTRYYAHKNLERVVDAFDRFRDELRGVTCVLTIAPDQHPLAATLLERIHARGLADRIVNLGPLRQDELASAYLACDALLHPTLLESFSSAYLEAMHFGRPILTSDLDFAREVCGDAAAYFDPFSVEAIRDRLVWLRDHPAAAAELAGRGSARVATTLATWPEILKDVLSVLEQAGEGTPTPEESRTCRYASTPGRAVC